MKYLKDNILLLFLCFWTVSQAQFNIPAKPGKHNQTSLYDYIGLLSKSQNLALTQKLIKYSDSTSTQIVIAIISSTQGENITYLGANWGEKWGIGQKGKDNGVLILLAKDDRKIAINTGYGVEGSLTDAMSRRIIETVIVPKFKQNDYYGGLSKGSDAIFKVLNGEFTEDRTFNDEGISFEAFLPFIIFFIILIILWSRKGNNNGNNGGGRRGSGLDFRDIIILSNLGRGGSSSGSGSFGGGGFSGGGFGGGFGGGGFGGGGASGGW
ncbi:TPM domain-containing protein [uncultured Maribacter sp.]|uniref:TPM domain-containing protein n=1 Tax=uncultured Maribacter sp. TaxID=431308 RepID=UPI00260F302B|nr:TPM domain-containing protein [uncultured Maribacter sp.]